MKKIIEIEKEEEIDEDSKDKEESELEETLEDVSIDTGKLQEFMTFKAPVLERVDRAPQIVTLERGVQDAPSTTNNQDDPFKYIPSPAEEEKKYISSDSHITLSPERADFSRIGREDPRSKIEQGSMFMGERQDQGSTNIEKYTVPERLDIHSAGRKKPDDRKYEPKLPKH